MISQLIGQLLSKTDKTAVVLVGGVGFLVYLSSDSLKRLGPINSDVTLLTHLIVREDVLDLYGFTGERERRFFQLLLSVSGIGPKSALAILSLAAPEVLERAIIAGDGTYLTKVSGIGRKSAEKIVLELKDKIGNLPGVSGGESGDLKEESEVIEALQSLGYSLREAREALRQIDPKIPDTGARIKAVLKLLSK